jgi:hypothetical protein
VFQGASTEDPCGHATFQPLAGEFLFSAPLWIHPGRRGPTWVRCGRRAGWSDPVPAMEQRSAMYVRDFARAPIPPLSLGALANAQLQREQLIVNSLSRGMREGVLFGADGTEPLQSVQFRVLAVRPAAPWSPRGQTKRDSSSCKRRAREFVVGRRPERYGRHNAT